MCRFALYLGEELPIADLVTLPDHSILQQSVHSNERSEPLNGDGFGVAWYVGGYERPAVFKEVNPAWSSINLQSLARVTRSHCVLAHVRAASPGLAVTQLNCHPFARGPLSFMHNGHLGGFPTYKLELLQSLEQGTFLGIQGSTDSEHLFALMLDAWAAAVEDEPLPRLERAVREAIERAEALRHAAGAEEPSQLNLVLCDGRRAVVSRYSSSSEVPANSLHLHVGRRYVCEEGVCRMLEPEEGQGAVIVASEPLSDDPGWRRVPDDHLVLVDSACRVAVVPL